MYETDQIKWRSTTIYVDVDTAEIIGKEEALNNYIKIKTKKETHVYKQTGTIKYTIECRRSNQLKLGF